MILFESAIDYKDDLKKFLMSHEKELKKLIFKSSIIGLASLGTPVAALAASMKARQTANLGDVLATNRKINQLQDLLSDVNIDQKAIVHNEITKLEKIRDEQLKKSRTAKIAISGLKYGLAAGSIGAILGAYRAVRRISDHYILCRKSGFTAKECEDITLNFLRRSTD